MYIYIKKMYKRFEVLIMTTKASQTEKTESRENRAIIERIKSRMKLKTTLLVFLIALLAVTTGTLAWFTLNTFSAVDNLEMTIGTGAQLLVSTENHGKDLSLYTKEITNEMINEYLREYDVTLDEILLDPLTSQDGIEFFTRSGVKKTENVGGYLEFPIWFIGTKDMYVHLTTDDTNPDKNDGTGVYTTETGIKADIVNCPRVSFTQDDGTSVIYEPNRGTPVAGQTTFDLQTPMVYTNGTRLFFLEAMTPKRIMVRLWVEGEDPQCDDDVQDAQLTVALCFMGTDENNEAIV